MPMHPFSIRQALLAAACASTLLVSTALARTPTSAEPPIATTNPDATFALPLRLKWTPGEAIRTRTTTHQRSVSKSEPPRETEEKTVIVTRVKVLSVDASGNAEVESVVESMRVEGVAPKKFTFDSTRSTNDLPEGHSALSTAKLFKDPMTFVIAPDGAVVEFPDFDALVDRMFKRIAESSASRTPHITDKKADSLKELNESFKSFVQANRGLVQQSLLRVPSARLSGRTTRLGETWESGSMGYMLQQIVNKSTFAAIEMLNATQVARISTKAELSPDSSGQSSMPMPIPMKSLSSDISGDIWLDAQRGRVLKEVVVSLSSMEFELDSIGKPFGSSVAITIITEDISNEPVPAR